MWGSLPFLYLRWCFGDRSWGRQTCTEESIIGAENVCKIEGASTTANEVVGMIQVRAREVRNGRLQGRKTGDDLVSEVSATISKDGKH